MKPLIGITPSLVHEVMPHGDVERYALATSYVDAVAVAGGVPTILPLRSADVDSLLDQLDGLLLSGGADVDPSRYGDNSVHPTTYGISRQRDDFELALVDQALERDLPLLCICRGIQVLNVALGGTLIQDIADQWNSTLHHRQHDVGIDKEEIGHQVRVMPGTLLGEVYGRDVVGVNSFHHQAVRNVGRSLAASAAADDGLVEAVELPGKRFVLGVQWHPEMMFERHPIHLQPFQALVDAARSRTLVASVS